MKQKQKNKIFFLVFSIFLFLLTTTANASPVKLNVDRDFFGWNDIGVNFNTSPLTVDAGEFQVNYSGTYTSGILPAFCVDLTNPLQYGENNINGTVAPQTYAINGLYVEWLVDYALTTKTSQKNPRAGLQLAVWEVLYDFDISAGSSPYNLSNTDPNGYFEYDTATTHDDTDAWYDAYIDRFIKAVDTNVFDAYTSTGKYTVLQLSTDAGDSQDLITVVPIPSTIMLLGIGLLGLGAICRRKI